MILGQLIPWPKMAKKNIMQNANPFGLEESSQQPDVGAYTSLLATLDRDGRWEAALDFWATTLTDGIQVAAQAEYRKHDQNCQ